MNILQVSTYDKGGGAEAIAWQLFERYQRLGHQSSIAVGEKRSTDPFVIPLPKTIPGTVIGGWLAQSSRWLYHREGRVRGMWRLRRWLGTYGTHPQNWWQALAGREIFNFPETWKLLDVLQERPDILHCHNLHGGWLPRGGYFDLRALPWLSRQVPTVVTLHDTWMLSGHCAYTLGCDRWKTGCGTCPDLSIYPSIWRDNTAFNWNRKQEIYAAGRFHVATPSHWLMRQVEKSMLAPGVVQSRVIPNGVDRSVFRPFSKARAREELGLSCRDAILLFAASGARTNMFKDYRTVEECAVRVGALHPRAKVTLIVLGDQGETIQFGNGEVRFGAFVSHRETIARYYQAADVYVHAAKSDTFPTTILEALSCGLPVVATAVDGIPEQIEDDRCGYLVPPGDAGAMAERVVQILSNDALRLSLGSAASERAARLYTMEKQVQTYLEWYEEIIALTTSERVLPHAS
ncbi:MAG: glycosyltransferase [Nitrospira sp.]|nr:glycosyltransferase [Nitrospira sp.]